MNEIIDAEVVESTAPDHHPLTTAYPDNGPFDASLFGPDDLDARQQCLQSAFSEEEMTKWYESNAFDSKNVKPTCSRCWMFADDQVMPRQKEI